MVARLSQITRSPTRQVVGEGLVVKHEDGELVHAGPEACEGAGIVDQTEVDRAHLGHEMGVERAERQGHAPPPASK